MAPEFFFLEFGDPAHHFAEDLVNRAFQLLLGFLQLFPDGDALGAVLFALAAADAVGGGGGIGAQGGTHGVLLQRHELAVGIAAVIGGEGTGNVHTLGAALAVAAAGAAHLHFAVDGIHHASQHGFLGLAQLPCGNCGGGLHIVPDDSG